MSRRAPTEPSLLPPDVDVLDVRWPLGPSKQAGPVARWPRAGGTSIDLEVTADRPHRHPSGQPRPGAAELTTAEETGQRGVSLTVTQRERQRFRGSSRFRGRTLGRYDVRPAGIVGVRFGPAKSPRNPRC